MLEAILVFFIVIFGAVVSDYEAQSKVQISECNDVMVQVFREGEAITDRLKKCERKGKR